MRDGSGALPADLDNDAEWVVIEVQDTGVGMSREVCERVFEPFFTTKPIGKGTGLGLSTVHSAVEQAHGRTTIESTLGSGSTFRVFLPAVRAEVQDPAHKEPAEYTAAKASVLICEDDHLVRASIEALLARAGYAVRTASDGHEALAIMDSSANSIDLLITDVMMPKMNGRQLAERLRRQLPELPVLFLSGYTADVLTEQELEVAGVDYVQKPFEPQILLHRVQTLLSEARRMA